MGTRVISAESESVTEYEVYDRLEYLVRSIKADCVESQKSQELRDVLRLLQTDWHEFQSQSYHPVGKQKQVLYGHGLMLIADHARECRVLLNVYQDVRPELEPVNAEFQEAWDYNVDQAGIADLVIE